MDRKLNSIIPRVPNWRWVMYHALLGRDHPDLTDKNFKIAARRLKEEASSKRAPFDVLELTCVLEYERDLKRGNEPDPDLDRALRLPEEKAISGVIEAMLKEHCETQWVVDALYYKFKEAISEETIGLYKKLFCDTDRLSAYDIASADPKGHTQPVVSGPWRDKHLAHRAGADIDIDPEAMLEDIMKDGFFRAKELQRFGMAADDTVIKYQKNVMSAYKTLKDNETGQTADLPDIFKRTIIYSEQTATDANELDGYDPLEASGHEEKDDV